MGASLGGEPPFLSVSQFASREGVTRARVLRWLARKYVWWLSGAEVDARPDLAITQTMELGDYEDVLRLEATLGRERMAQALRRAEAGRFSERSWTYWLYRLGLARPGRVPRLPKRRLR